MVVFYLLDVVMIREASKVVISRFMEEWTTLNGEAYSAKSCEVTQSATPWLFGFVPIILL